MSALHHITPDMQVVIIDRSTLHPTVTNPLTVKGVGKRDIILEDGSRWSINAGHEQGRPSVRRTLAPADDPQVADIRAAARRRAALRRAQRELDTLSTKRAGYTLADIDALQAAVDACKAAAVQP